MSTWTRSGQTVHTDCGTRITIHSPRGAGPESWPQIHADLERIAELVRCAPELFEALQVLLEFDGISAREKARAALVKATGGMPTP